MLAAAADWFACGPRSRPTMAAFATPPAANAKELAREASRAERVSNVQQARQDVMRLEQELAAARAGRRQGGEKESRRHSRPKLTAAVKARDAAQAAWASRAKRYTHFGEVYPATSTAATALARWIASKNNPLTARVAINHIWLRHFGSPLVPTVFDFGLNGKPPTHPALLDWLAVELMDQGWRMKAIHRLIVTSTAYRMQSSSADDEPTGPRDPENVYLWRMNPRRMEAEVVRDSTLRVADGLDPTMFGPELDQATGLTVPRRSIYFRSSKEKKVTFLEMFDSPNVTDCYRRSETVVPQQALAMVNSSLTLAQGAAAGRRAGRRNWTRRRRTRACRVHRRGVRARCCAARPATRSARACLEFLDAQSGRLADPQALVAFTSGGRKPGQAGGRSAAAGPRKPGPRALEPQRFFDGALRRRDEAR